MIVEILLSALVIYLTVKYVQFTSRFRDFSQLPGPKTYPLVGNALEFENNPISILRNMRRLTKEHGGLFRLWMGCFSPALVISSEKHMEYFLGSSEHINKSDVYKMFEPWLGEGLIVSNGSKWRNHRKIITPAFHLQILEQFVPIFCNCGDKLVEKLKLQGDKEFDVYPFINLFALDSICESSMGISIGAQDTPDLEYVKSVQGFLNCHMERYFSLLKKSDFFFKFSKLHTVQMRHAKILRSFVEEAITKRKRERISESKTGSDGEIFGQKKRMAFLDLLLDMAQNNDMSEKDIREEVDNIMFAGHDSVSSALSLALYEFSKHPEVQHLMLEEIKSTIKDGAVTYQSLQGLKYMEAVIKEVLRLHTTVPIINRQLRKDVVYEGARLPKGTVIFVNLEGLHHCEDSFPEPYEFRPERFFADECAKRHPYAYVPFSAGPRNCVGQKFAMLSMKTTLVKIISNFEICPVAGFEPELGNSAVLKSFNGVHIRLVPLKLDANEYVDAEVLV